MSYRWTETDLLKLSKRAIVDGVMRPNQVTASSTGPLAPSQKRPKYGNRRVTDAEGNVHDSSKEYRRWCELQLREKAGEISWLRRQVPFALVVNDIPICVYKLDFRYDCDGQTIYEDVKPDDPKFRKTAAYRMFHVKQKLMLACHGIQVREV